ncbi:RNA polymerase sigma factor SigJ [Saccharopolyspora sp. 5N708]|uniref:RNA polymerase sigma factor SigJ n=1 Tax=Saccharopolyspora sp. 5N708 TaxID=3457424 RepID=UPI003FD14039
MSDEAVLAAAYTRARPRLVRIAYAVTGSHAEAEDVVSDSWPRLVAADANEPVQDVEAWATVVVARRALYTLRSARARRETYVGPWLPEPWLEVPSPDPADRATLDDSVSYALLVALETLSPAERTAWVLHDLFGMEFAEVARIIGRTPAAVRQLADRARKHVVAGTPRVEVDPATHEAVVDAFRRATAEGDIATLMTVLNPAVTLTSDGGGQVRAARRPVHGADRVARMMVGLSKQMGSKHQPMPVLMNGAPGLAMLERDEYDLVISLTLNRKRIYRVDIIRTPDKLTLLHETFCASVSHVPADRPNQTSSPKSRNGQR